MQLQTNKQTNKKGAKPEIENIHNICMLRILGKFFLKKLHFSLLQPHYERLHIVADDYDVTKKGKNEVQHVRAGPNVCLTLLFHFNFRNMHAILFIRSVTTLYRFVLFVCLVVTMNTTWTCPISL
jgi:hypothetical protein